MPTPTPASAVNDGLYRFSGIYGSAWRDGEQLAEAVEFTGNVAVGRIDIPLVGKTKTGYKPGRETREGTLRIQKIDTKWEMEIFQFLNTNLHQRRVNRDNGTGTLRPFSLLLEYDDPDALGRELWQLDGCLLWQMPVGFSIGDDLVEREFPVTWEQERPIYAFEATKSSNGTLQPTWFAQAGPPPPER